MRFVAYDVEPVKDYGDFVEVCLPEDADFWSVYGRLENGEAVCIGDFTTQAVAEEIKGAIQASASQ